MRINVTVIRCGLLLWALLASGCGESGNSDRPVSENPISETPTETEMGSDEPVEEPDAGILPHDSAVLSWSAPLTRENGDSIAMGELGEYVISFGQSSDPTLSGNQVILDNASAMAEGTHRFDSLAAGTWYFAVQVTDMNGRISMLSKIVSKNVPAQD